MCKTVKPALERMSELICREYRPPPIPPIGMAPHRIGDGSIKSAAIVAQLSEQAAMIEAMGGRFLFRDRRGHIIWRGKLKYTGI